MNIYNANTVLQGKVLMNDFTKEELFKIRQAVIATSFKPWLVPMIETGDANFIEKIERMIENYCEHEWKFLCSDFPEQCKKCGAMRE